MDQDGGGAEGAFQHILNDLFAFIATAVAGLVMVLTGFTRADAIATLIVVMLMVKAGVGLVRESSRIFLEAAPAGLDPGRIGTLIAARPDVAEIHDLHIWEITSGQPALSAHILVRRARTATPCAPIWPRYWPPSITSSTPPCRSTTPTRPCSTSPTAPDPSTSKTPMPNPAAGAGAGQRPVVTGLAGSVVGSVCPVAGVGGTSGSLCEVNPRSRRLLETTNTLDNAMAAPAIIGLSSPAAARGRAARL